MIERISRFHYLIRLDITKQLAKENSIKPSKDAIDQNAFLVEPTKPLSVEFRPGRPAVLLLAASAPPERYIVCLQH